MSSFCGALNYNNFCHALGTYILYIYYVQVDQRSSTLYGVVVTALAMGSCLLVDNVTEPLPLILAQLVSPRFLNGDGGGRGGRGGVAASNLRMILLGAKAQPTPIASDFRLLLRTERGAHEFSQYFIDKVGWRWCFEVVETYKNHNTYKTYSLFEREN